MSVDIAYNKQVVRDKFDDYLDEMIGPGSVAYQQFVEPHTVTRGIRKRKLQQLRRDLEKQRDLILEYAETCLTADDDADIRRDADAAVDGAADDVNTHQYVNRFLDTNPFLNEFTVDRSVVDQVHATMTEHFFYITDELQDLLDTDIPDDADNAFGALLRGTYDKEEAKQVLQKNFTYTDQLKDYKQHISLGWKGLLMSTSFADDIWPVFEKGEQQLGKKITEELDEIYG